ncbi:MAG: CHAT domain-containing protein, partial [Gammaproteobacteria bacterium]|nr:CHAT domain-containing protein [Gammaproteobacteria bacterium]
MSPYLVLFLALLGSSAYSMETAEWIRQGDKAFNAGDYARASSLYRDAEKRSRKANRDDLLCELENNAAAVAMAQGDMASFRQRFAKATRCTRALTASASAQSGNLLHNGGFEEGLRAPWGTGHYENSAGKTAFGVWWNSNNARAFMKLDRDQMASGCCSLRITNFSPTAPHVFTTTSQRIHGLQPNRVYRVTLRARAENLAQGAVSFAVDAGWGKRLLSLPQGSWGWQSFSGEINIGHNDYMDLRLIHQNTGTLWLDDIQVSKVEASQDDPHRLLQHAQSLMDQARFSESLALYSDLERRYADNPGLMLQVHHHRGAIQLQLGRYQEALQAFQWLDERGFRDAPQNLGDLYQALGEWEKAETQYQRALGQVEGDQGSYSLVLDRIAANALSRGDPTGALDAQQRSLHILRHIGDLHGQARALTTLADIQRRLGQSAVGASLDEAIGLARRLDDRLLLGDLLSRRAVLPDKTAVAMELLSEALSIQREIGDSRGAIATLHARGRYYREQGDAVRALADMRGAVELLREVYDRLGGMPRTTRQAFMDQFNELYRELVDLLLQQYAERPAEQLADELLRLAEESRARSFTEMINETRAARELAEEGGDPRFRQHVVKEREARLALDAINRRLASLAADSPDLPALREQRTRADTAYRDAYDALAVEFPRFADLKRPAPLGIKDIQALLRPGEALLAYFITENRTGVWALRQDDFQLSVLPVGREALVRQARPLIEAMPALAAALQAVSQHPGSRQIRASLDAAGAYNLEDAYRLYRTLAEPVAPIFQEQSRIYLVPDDLLYRLPFEALPTQPPLAGRVTYWVNSHAFSYLPSAAVLRSLRMFKKKPRRPGRPLAAFADPILDGSEGLGQADEVPSSAALAQRGVALRRLRDGKALGRPALDPLPETAAEARTAARLLGGRPEDIFLRERASERQVKAMSLIDYRYLLFATHGLLAGEFRRGLQPALVMSFVDDPDNDGLLEMGEILGLDLNADLVVLSACNTGRDGAESDR